MTTVFDGMAGVLNSVLGAPVSVYLRGAELRQMQAYFRMQPMEAAQDDGGSVLVQMPMLEVPKTDADQMRRGDIVLLSDGQQFKVLSRNPNGSPASDAFIAFALEEDHADAPRFVAPPGA